MQFIKWKW